MLEVIHHRALLEIAADGRIAQQGEDIVPFAIAVGDGIVALAIVELVMIFVMRRRPGKCGKTVEQGDPIVGEMIQDGRPPYRDMIVVMGDDGNRYGEIKG